MNSTPEKNLSLAHRYIELCNNPDATAADLRELYDEQVRWQEMPSYFAPTGKILSLEAMLAAFTQGQELMATQQYILRDAVANEDSVALQISWTSTLAKELGDFPAGKIFSGEMAIFMRLKDEKIISQTDYLCYQPVP